MVVISTPCRAISDHDTGGGFPHGDRSTRRKVRPAADILARRPDSGRFRLATPPRRAARARGAVWIENSDSSSSAAPSCGSFSRISSRRGCGFHDRPRKVDTLVLGSSHPSCPALHRQLVTSRPDHHLPAFGVTNPRGVKVVVVPTHSAQQATTSRSDAGHTRITGGVCAFGIGG